MRCGRNRVVLASVPQDGSQVGETGVLGLTQTPDSASAGGGPNQHCWTHHAPLGQPIPFSLVSDPMPTGGRGFSLAAA